MRLLEFSHTERTYLWARSAIVLSEITENLDLEYSKYLRDQAKQVVFDLAFAEQDAASKVPSLIKDYPDLMANYRQGKELSNLSGECASLEPELVWQGRWTLELEGNYESRPSVHSKGNRFIPALELRYKGQECTPSFYEECDSFEQAKKVSVKKESAWLAALA